MTPNPAHVLGIDAVRFLAALMVMLFHFGFWAGFMHGSHAELASQGLVIYPALSGWTKYGWIGVQIFFVISGFVIAYSAEKASAYRFFVSRSVRLFPAALLCATITLGVLLLVGSMPKGELASAYIKSIVFWPSGPWIDDSYWTLAIEIAFYGLVFLLLAINRFVWISRLAIIIGLMSFAFNIVLWLGQDVVAIQQLKEKRLFELLLLHHGSFFALGVFLWLQLLKQPSRRQLMWIGIFVAACCMQILAVVASLNHKHVGLTTPVPLIIWLLALVVIVMSVRFNALFATLPVWIALALRRVGLMTYPLYLIHQNTGLAGMGHLIKNGISPYLALALGIGGVLAASWAISTYLEPHLQKWMKTFLLALPGKMLLRTAGT